MKLREIFRAAQRKSLPDEWLYLPADKEWTLDTDGIFLNWEKEEKDTDEIPIIARKQNLKEALDASTIEQAVAWADRLSGQEDDSARLDVFKYYFRFDAFPDRLGAPDPPPAEDIIRRLDRQFYDSLGEEAAETPCRHDGCTRGSLRLGVFCRIHHFENIKRKPCPFTD
jgi:hypothetical protein